MKLILMVCVFICVLSAQYTIHSENKTGDKTVKSKVYIFENEVVTLTGSQVQFYDLKSNSLYQANMKKKTLKKISFEQINTFKPIISKFLSDMKVNTLKAEDKILGYNVTKKRINNKKGGMAHLDITFQTTTEADIITPAYIGFVKKVSEMIPYDIPFKKNEVVLNIDVAWELGMAKMFLKGKQKKFAEMSMTMNVTSIDKGVKDSKIVSQLNSFKKI